MYWGICSRTTTNFCRAFSSIFQEISTEIPSRISTGIPQEISWEICPWNYFQWSYRSFLKFFFLSLWGILRSFFKYSPRNSFWNSSRGNFRHFFRNVCPAIFKGITGSFWSNYVTYTILQEFLWKTP